jgi:hypothetical protein
MRNEMKKVMKLNQVLHCQYCEHCYKKFESDNYDIVRFNKEQAIEAMGYAIQDVMANHKGKLNFFIGLLTSCDFPLFQEIRDKDIDKAGLKAMKSERPQDIGAFLDAVKAFNVRGVNAV